MHGILRTQAFCIMDRVRKGKGITKDIEWDMLIARVPGWYIDSCNTISYLYPRLHAVDYMLLYWKFAYYEYKNTLENIQDKAVIAP